VICGNVAAYSAARATGERADWFVENYAKCRIDKTKLIVRQNVVEKNLSMLSKDFHRPSVYL
jgi:hypothetical protein